MNEFRGICRDIVAKGTCNMKRRIGMHCSHNVIYNSIAPLCGWLPGYFVRAEYIAVGMNAAIGREWEEFCASVKSCRGFACIF